MARKIIIMPAIRFEKQVSHFKKLERSHVNNAGPLVNLCWLQFPHFCCEEKSIPHMDFVGIKWDSTHAIQQCLWPGSAVTHSGTGNSLEEQTTSRQQQTSTARPWKASLPRPQPWRRAREAAAGNRGRDQGGPLRAFLPPSAGVFG